MSVTAALRQSLARYFRSTAGHISLWWLATTFLGLFAAVSLIGIDFDDTTPFGSAIGDEIQSEPLPEFSPSLL